MIASSRAPTLAAAAIPILLGFLLYELWIGSAWPDSVGLLRRHQRGIRWPTSSAPCP